MDIKTLCFDECELLSSIDRNEKIRAAWQINKDGVRSLDFTYLDIEGYGFTLNLVLKYYIKSFLLAVLYTVHLKITESLEWLPFFLFLRKPMILVYWYLLMYLWIIGVEESDAP